jgi:riboflavin synthase
MFTGLVEGRGTVVGVERSEVGARIEIEAQLASELTTGDSIAINGACLTAREISGSRFRADVVWETLRRTTLGGLAAGSSVNLELALRASDRLGGHFVLGHVDGVGEVRAVHESGEIEVQLDEDLARYVVEKGSIALDGVSLTVAAIDGSTVTIALIPQTREATTFGALVPGSRLNVEVDILAKHIERLAVAYPEGHRR